MVTRSHITHHERLIAAMVAIARIIGKLGLDYRQSRILVYRSLRLAEGRYARRDVRELERDPKCWQDRGRRAANYGLSNAQKAAEDGVSIHVQRKIYRAVVSRRQARAKAHSEMAYKAFWRGVNQVQRRSSLYT